MRSASREDLDALLGLYGELIDRVVEHAPGGGGGDLGEVLEAILADDARHLTVATVEERVVGSADLLIAPNLTHDGRPWGIVENVIVASAHRREGVGRALMAHLFSSARAAGCYKVQLLSGKHRSEAHRFYRSIGFDAVAEGFKSYFAG